MVRNIIKVKEIETMCFKDKNENVIAELDNVDEIALTSNVIEERNILGNVENIKKGETTLSFTSTIEKETLFKAFGFDMSKTPDAYKISITKPVQARKHKKKRINKKWLKKYGYKILVDFRDGWHIKSYIDGHYEFVKGEKNNDRT